MSRLGRNSLATSGLVLLFALLAARAVDANQFAYVAGFGDGRIAAGRVEANGAIFTLGSSPFDTDSASLEGIASSPDGKRLYVAGFTDFLYRFKVAGSGNLSRSGGSSQPLGPQAYGVTVTPNGKFIYAAATAESEVRGFRPTGNGGIAATTQESVNLPSPTGVAVSPNGKILYALSQVSPGEIHAYRIAGNGGLSEISGSPFDTGPVPFAVVLAPNGKRLYVADRNSPAFIHAYSVNGNGSLDELTASPYPADGGNPFGMAISPDGDNLYTANYDSDTISGFSIDADGELAALPGSVYPGPENPAALTLSASGEKLYAVSGNAAMTTYDVGADGALENRLFALFGTTGDFQSIALTPAQPPRAQLTAPRKPSGPGDSVKLSARKSTDDGEIIEYAWKFGDGAKTFTMKPKATHRYEKPGTYKATVTLTDDDGCSTKYVSTGQTAYCNGSKRAKASAKVKVKK